MGRERHTDDRVAKVFIMAVLIDFIYQLIVFRWFYPGPAVIVAILLVVSPPTWAKQGSANLNSSSVVSRWRTASGKLMQKPNEAA